MQNTLLNNYIQRAKSFAETAEQLQDKYNRFSMVRLAIFVVGIGVLIYGWSWHPLLGGLLTALFLFGFYRFVLWHQQLKVEQRHQEFLAQINRLEAQSLQGDYSHFGAGSQFANPAHPYTVDLDIFGDYSFFQYTNRTSTAIGQQRLAHYLMTDNIGPAEVLARQEAIAELQNRLDWRQHFQAFGMEAEDHLEQLDLLKAWLHDPAFVMNNRFYQLAIHVSPILVSLGIYLWIFHLPWYLAILFFLLPMWILKKTKEQVDYTHLRTTHAAKALAHYARLVAHIEKHEFSSPKLAALRDRFTAVKPLASERMGQLSYYIKQLNLRYNVFVVLLNVFSLWDLRWVRKLEIWRAEQRELLPQWFDALAEFEALHSFGTLHFNNPDWTFAEVTEGDKVVMKGAGHPLIAADKRVSNDLEVPIRGHIKLLTGSNMAGKSTFLRTVGLNIVLANIGAPVCAEKMSLPLLQVYTSMRTQDALHESTSSFYAELKRLKFIIDAVEKGENIFFLLDEILKGTNSNDRHEGSKALIRQLIENKGSGIIATHDLDLGKLEATYAGAIENLRIEVSIQDGKLSFDYKIKKGVSESFNATILMREMGIAI